MKSSVALIGFMGTGKTAAGRVLAARLGREFVELDALIELRAGKRIPDIFRDAGETAFRELEIAAVKEAAGRKRAVIACGGGIVLNRINIDRLSQECVIVCLTASPAAILERTAGDHNRPLLDAADRLSRITGMLKQRRPYYEQAAEVTVNTTRLTVDEVVDEVVRRLKEHDSFDF
ncbi:MAG: shikimate kinase [Chloroflexi bacterium]|nr:shikimate kinase [Chloroflexota bacterium]